MCMCGGGRGSLEWSFALHRYMLMLFGVNYVRAEAGSSTIATWVTFVSEEAEKYALSMHIVLLIFKGFAEKRNPATHIFLK